MFLENPKLPGKFTEILKPVCSEVILTAPEDDDLKIVEISDIFTPIEGGKKMIILCQKVSADNITVHFSTGEIVKPWQAVVHPDLVHHGCAIVLYTPAYEGSAIQEYDVGEEYSARVEIIRKVFVSLVRPSDGMFSKHVEMFYVTSR